MLTEYIRKAMQAATYEILEDGSFYGEIPPCPGVWATAENLEACRDTLQEVLEEWLINCAHWASRGLTLVGTPSS